MGKLPAGADSALDAIERIATRELTAQEVLEQVAPRIDRVVPSDGYFLAAVDPDTTLSLGAGVVHELPEELCGPTWEYEFMVPDYLKFADLARSGHSVGDLHEVTGGRPQRSPRWREYAGATGFHSELRVAFTAGGATWGVGQLDRLGDSPRYSEDERAWLERVAPIVAQALRRALLTQSGSAEPRGPGIVVLDERGTVTSATQEAEDWLREVQSAVPIDAGSPFPIPFEAYAYAAKVRASIDKRDKPPRTRLRTRKGVWLLMHAAMLQGTDQLALVVEPAKASDVAPLIVEAYGLTARELDVTRAIARGLGTADIAKELFVSPHTVRDHVKAVFEKVGVSSRGELVAKVFAEHYAPAPHA